ncbi:MAG TPA: prolipoprotein diacylglyceryl transferase [Gracilimonas sp.]|uniref:prolipoprotein diacylglyceryl transferase n=1 Tax=Gracilimonas sp. TaxID=1974203 RepID=UPI002D98A03F|nr:prolipoprotein diacylglyceryl transferase [Gracilimonas sp.]
MILALFDNLTWGIDPVIFELGPLAPRWYGILFAGAFVAGYLFGVKMWKDAGRKVEEMENILTWILVGTVIGARLGHVIFYDPSYYLRNLDQVLAVWNGGLASHGAAIAIIITIYYLAKKTPKMNFWWLADRVVIPTAIGGAFIRFGNFTNSEIYGHETDAPWGVIFSNLPGAAGMIPRHPTMLYEAILCLLVFAVLWTIYKKYEANPPSGSLFGTFLILLFSGRFFLEYTKVPQADFASDWALNMGQILSIPMVLIGLYIVIKMVNWNEKGTNLKTADS